MDDTIPSQRRLAAALSCFGLMAGTYDLLIVNLVRPVLEEEFGIMNPLQDAILTGAALGGAMIGQVGFGASADYLGRRLLFISTATLVGLSCIGCAIALPVPSLGLHIYAVIAIWRFLLGVGIGGEYPLAAATTVENTDSASSGRELAVVYCGLAAGQLLAPGTVMLLAGPLQVPGPRLWRYALGFGAVLAFMVAGLRYLHLRETRSWSESRREVSEAERKPETFRDKVAAFWIMRRAVASTVGVWLIYDVVTYGVGLFSTTIFPASSGLGSAKIVFFINMITAPGYIGAVFLASRVPMRQIQLFGLVGMCFLFFVMVSTYAKVARTGIVYLSMFSFMRCVDAMGPGVSTFSVPGQIYPTRIRATAHGMSAAAGKLGAVIGTVIFPYLYASAGLRGALVVMALLCGMACAWTIAFTPYYDVRVLDAIANLDSSMPLSQQASIAESLLFPVKGKGSSASLSLERSAGALTYGAIPGASVRSGEASGS